jgi:fluoride ion exporter CrcB/FEX
MKFMSFMKFFFFYKFNDTVIYLRKHHHHRHAALNNRNKEGYSAVYLSIINTEVSVFKKLLTAGANMDTNITQKNEFTKKKDLPGFSTYSSFSSTNISLISLATAKGIYMYFILNCVYGDVIFVYMDIYVLVHICIYVYSFDIYVYIYIYIYMHTCMYTCIYTDT